MYSKKKYDSIDFTPTDLKFLKRIKDDEVIVCSTVYKSKLPEINFTTTEDNSKKKGAEKSVLLSGLKQDVQTILKKILISAAGLVKNGASIFSVATQLTNLIESNTEKMLRQQFETVVEEEKVKTLTDNYLTHKNETFDNGFKLIRNKILNFLLCEKHTEDYLKKTSENIAQTINKIVQNVIGSS